MEQEKKKKLLEFIKSNAFCNSFLIFCSLIGALISVGNFNFVNELNAINILSFPIAFTIGVNGLIFIPTICENKLKKIETSKIKETNNREIEENKEEIKEEIIKKEYSSRYLVDIIDNIIIANSIIGVKIDLLAEWQEYLENTFLDPKGIKIVQELIYYFMLLNSLPIEKVVSLLKNKEYLIDLLIHFSNNGDNLANALNKEIKEIKKERI